MFSCFSPFIQVKHKYTHISYIASIGLTNPLTLYDVQKAANFFFFYVFCYLYKPIYFTFD